MYQYCDAKSPAQFAILDNTRSKCSREIQTTRFECLKCDSTFPNKTYLHHHEMTAHQRRLKCPYCASLFSNKIDFGRHIHAHTEKKRLFCVYCGELFLDVNKFTSHNILCRERPQHKCDKCPAMFFERSKLRIHSFIHKKPKFVHTLSKFPKKRIVCLRKSAFEDGPSSPAQNRASSATASATSVSASCQTEAASSALPRGPEDSEPNFSEPAAGCSRSYESRENPKRSSFSPNVKCPKKANKKERRLKKTEAERITEAGGSSQDDIEIISVPEMPISSSPEVIRCSKDQETNTAITSATRKQVSTRPETANGETEADRLCGNHLKQMPASVSNRSLLEELRASFQEEADDEGVDLTTEEQPSTSTDQNVVHQTGRSHLAPTLEQTLETIDLISPETIPAEEEPYTSSDLTSDDELIEAGEVTCVSRRNLFSPKTFAEVQKSKSQFRSKTDKKKSSATGVNVIRNVTDQLIGFQFGRTSLSTESFSRVTILKPVALPATLVESGRANKVTSSVRRTAVVDSPKGMRPKSRPFYEPNLSNGRETMKSTAITAKSSTSRVPATDLENADSVYTFREDDSSRQTATSNTEGLTKNKRPRSERWRFFVTASTPTKKKARTGKLPERRSVHFYQCSRCSRRFSNISLLTQHQLLHSQSKGVLCTVCRGLFAGPGNLVNHKRFAHGSPVQV